MSKEFIDAVKTRRSYYGIDSTSAVSDERILELINDAVKYCPSAFNSQSARVLVLLGPEHKKLWEITAELLQKIVPADNFPDTKAKLDSFKNGHGTILYFEDQETVRGLQRQFSLYSENFPVWSLQSSGMLQYIVWTALEAEGLGASLQHYNPIIDERVKTAWDIPENWKLLGEMPFGGPLAEPEPKSFLPTEDRIKVFR